MMTIKSISKCWRFRPSMTKDLDRLYEVWHSSVIATHDFLNESDLSDICVQVKNDYLPNHSLLVAVDDQDRVIGFMGTSAQEIDSLFIDPTYRGNGLGRAFIEAAAIKSSILEVGVNAQNKQAVAFYEAVGFSVYAASPTDDDGRPYPLLRMRTINTGPPNLSESHCPAAIEIRPAVPEDADGIARTFLESAEYHAELDPERYSTPAVETISARYREGRQHAQADREVITLVAKLSGEIVGFIDASLEQSPDEMHREMIYCHIAEIAVRRGHRNRSIGGRLLRAAEDWGARFGAKFASLEYHAANTRAISFYQERMGYSPASITAIKRLKR